MRKRAALIVAMLAVAVSGATLAQAAGKTKSPAKKSHAIKGTVSLINLSTTGTPGPPVNGTAVVVGITDGKIDGKAAHGAVRGTTAYAAPSFTGSGTIFGPNGSTTYKLKGTGAVAPSGDVTFTGTGQYTGGTQAYKGAKGTFTFSGKQPKGSAVTTFTTSGSAKY